MKLICPHCSKSLAVPDDSAGKRGRCPACGQAVDVPALPITSADKEKPMTDDQLDRATAGLSQATQPDKQPAKPVPKALLGAAALGLIAVVATIFYLTGVFGPAKLPAVSLYSTDPQLYKARYNALAPATLSAWQNALAKATGEYITERNVAFALPNLERLWRSDATLNQTVSDTYTARLQAMASQVLVDWRDRLRAVSAGAVSPELTDTALRLVEIDRIFNGQEVDPKASQALLDRLAAIAPEQVAQWAEVLAVERGQAALVLVCMDTLFKGGQLNPEALAKQVARRR